MSRPWCPTHTHVMLHLESWLLRESIPRQAVKKSGVLKEEKGVWNSQGEERGLEFSRRRKGQTSFFSPLLSLVLVM